MSVFTVAAASQHLPNSSTCIDHIGRTSTQPLLSAGGQTITGLGSRSRMSSRQLKAFRYARTSPVSAQELFTHPLVLYVSIPRDPTLWPIASFDPVHVWLCNAGLAGIRPDAGRQAVGALQQAAAARGLGAGGRWRAALPLHRGAHGMCCTISILGTSLQLLERHVREILNSVDAAVNTARGSAVQAVHEGAV